MNSQTDQVIEERRKKIEANRKKIVYQNLWSSIFFALIIFGLAGTIFFYNQSESSKRREMLVNDTLRMMATALQYSKDSLQEAKATLAKQKAINDSILIVLYKATPSKSSESITTAVNKLTNSRDAAREFNHEAYRKLKVRDFRGAMEAFNKSEKAYNGYRDSYDVWFLLWSNRAKLDNPTTQKQLLEKIVNNYNSLKILTNADNR